MRNYGAGRDNLLFSEHDWFALEQHMNQTLASEILDMDPDRLLNTAQDAMAGYFVSKFTLELPVIRKGDITVEHREAEIDISRRFEYGYSGVGPGTVRGIEYEAHIPFDGDPGLFKTRPTTHSSSIPRGTVNERQCVLVHIVRNVQLSPAQVEASIDGFVAEIDEHLTWLGNSTRVWNSQLPAKVAAQLADRRQKLVADRTAAGSLKYKIRERPGTAKTYAAPEVKRKVAPTMPPAASQSWKPEPVLEMSLYEHILKSITDAAMTWERSPTAFASMGEEDLRTQILFHLNGHFEGQGTAETFNKEGKTDILIRSQGKNIFIGECKFWGGAKVLTETIDQLLGYVSWRDTKVAVIIFNRNKNFGAVIDQIRSTTEAHPNCKQFVSKVSEAQFRFLFTQRDDPNREMTLTVVAFDVPQP
jgi:hypothetical protein